MDPTEPTLHTVDGRPQLRLRRELAHPPAKVWRAITDPAELVHWFPAAVRTELRAGAPMHFVFDGGELVDTDGEILEIDPPRVFVYRWGQEVLRWEIVPAEHGCVLDFSHTFTGPDAWGDRLAAPRHAAGWMDCLDALDDRLDGRPTPASGPADGGWFDRCERYTEAFGVAEGLVDETPEGFRLRVARDLVQSAEEIWAVLGSDEETTPPDAAASAGRAEDAENRDADGDATPTTAPSGSPAVGAAPPLRFTNGFVPAGPVVAVEPARVLEYRWEHDGAPAGVLRWEFHAHDYGCAIQIVQTVPAALADSRADALAAWQTHLEVLARTLHGRPQCWPFDRTEELRRRYEARLS
ncbi:uncharacterized protein YndB with AHSA1/START domain [Actinoalloteichus hoggarensis]|uniref:Activator of Hsp90 ATPase homologue 1/2-like C-terminal domain-containing protein n=1 Tax=Actinoalloteichus hoggarensis TaxID=1470176 RepID=A0A221VYL6_9PSEU|nr:SRPBCC family protein [Actinoalloteichus hoggarensis]ASO18620.1 hypothetical protein AHOG_04830 [Actinoalloteichus hoggarensis]MBB5921987.1 uncharacterized protein YndB with AHSA1/START domain [Actinoalloteichus hoggarensis]